MGKGSISVVEFYSPGKKLKSVSHSGYRGKQTVLFLQVNQALPEVCGEWVKIALQSGPQLRKWGQEKKM